MDREAQAAQATAERMLAEARSHKRASAWHRERTRELMRQRDEFIAACQQRGVQINTQPKGGQGGQKSHRKTVS